MLFSFGFDFGSKFLRFDDTYRLIDELARLAIGFPSLSEHESGW
jgi:hypothetical protein